MKTEKLTIVIDTEENSAEVEIEMSAGNLIIAAGRILSIAAKSTGMNEMALAMSLVHANKMSGEKQDETN